MKPAKIIIDGDFWDCQIYGGRLYLWYTDGSLKVYDWDKIIDSFINDPTDELALKCAFSDGRFLYASNLSVLFNDIDFKTILTRKFDLLVNRDLEISSKDLDSFIIGEQDNPFKELQTDSEILNNNVYAITYDGLFKSKTHKPKNDKNPLNVKPKKVNDFLAFSIKAGKYAKLALSGGDEGLYEYNASESFFYGFDEEDKFKCISKRHSSFADFSYLSLYNSSLNGNSFLSLRKWEDLELAKKKASKIVFEKEINQNEIFNTNRHSLSWGSNEKIYNASDNTLQVVNFNNYAENEDYFTSLKEFQFHPWKGKILKGGSAYFGTIIECENAIVVLMDNDDFYNIPGSATRWRIYPRSLNYENHLHVIFDDRLEIYSFNNDYFRNQYNKDFGIKFTDSYNLRPSSLKF